jgi:Mg2+-importing ATPase
LSHSGWFIEPAITELAVMLVLRTSRPFCQSHPCPALLLSSITIAAITITLPYRPLPGPPGLTAVPAWILAALAALTALTAFDVIANQGAKHRFPPDDAIRKPRAGRGLG